MTFRVSPFGRVSEYILLMVWPLLPLAIRIKLSRPINQLQREAALPAPQTPTEVYLFSDAFRQIFPAARLVSSVTKDKPISLILTVKNEAHCISTFLDSVLNQSIPPDEVVICDGGSKDGTVEVIERWHQGKSVGWSLVLIREDNVNIATGRNRAIAAASHELIVCTDAGVTLEPRWLERLATPFFIDVSVDVVAGWYLMKASTSVHRGLQRFIVARLEVINPETFLPSARSLAFRRAAWERVGGFPEFLTFAGEDTYFALSLRSTTTRWGFVPEARVIWSPPEKRVFRMLSRYAQGDAELGMFSGYYLHLAQKVISCGGEFALGLGLLFIAAIFSSNLLLLCAIGACASALWSLVALLRRYQPWYEVLNFGAGLERILALFVLLPAQFLGSVRGYRNRSEILQRRLQMHLSFVMMPTDFPIHVDTAEFKAVERALNANVFVVNTYTTADTKAPLVHQSVLQLEQTVFELENWQNIFRNTGLKEITVGHFGDESVSAATSAIPQ